MSALLIRVERMRRALTALASIGANHCSICPYKLHETKVGSIMWYGIYSAVIGAYPLLESPDPNDIHRPPSLRTRDVLRKLLSFNVCSLPADGSGKPYWMPLIIALGCLVVVGLLGFVLTRRKFRKRRQGRMRLTSTHADSVPNPYPEGRTFENPIYQVRPVHLSQHNLCTRKTELALDMNFFFSTFRELHGHADDRRTLLFASTAL